MTSPHRPLLIVIAGPNGSGKTTITQTILHHEWLESAQYINPDIIAQQRFGDWNSQEAVLKAADYCKRWRAECLQNRQSLIFETVLSADDKIEFIRRAVELGYFVRLFFVSTESPAINAHRIAQRVASGGHDVPITKIISRFKKSIANCAVLASYVDRLYVYDNSVEGQAAQLLFRMAEGQLVRKYREEMPGWAQIILE